MQKPDNLAELPKSYVVITDEEEADKIQKEGIYDISKEAGQKQRRRDLRKTREWFETEKEYLEYLLVMDALDIELIPEDKEESEHLKFTWTLLAYEKSSLEIQLYFDSPEKISEEGT